MAQSEREKMLAGLPYNSRDPELMVLHRRARAFMAAYNGMAAAPPEERLMLLREYLGHAGANVWIEPPFFCDYACHISLGDNSYVNFNCVFLDCSTITIGSDVLIAPAVQIYAVTHPVLPEERLIPGGGQGDVARHFDKTAPVRIGDQCWIGGGAIILPGVSIGEGSTVGAGSVVSRDIPPRVLAVGNPCRVVREL